MKTCLLLLIVWVYTVPAAAQSSSSPVADALRSLAQRNGRDLVAAAEEMPGGKYGYKPTPAQMSFGDVIAHLGAGNDYLCSTISGVTAPKRSELKGDAPKARLVSQLKESFQFCQSALGKVDDSKLDEQLPFFGERKLSRAAVMMATAQDWADHYSQLANYLRLNRLLPPTAKRKE
ncbi:MAG: DinB family protein [Gemmatimonadales bacterium]